MCLPISHSSTLFSSSILTPSLLMYPSLLPHIPTLSLLPLYPTLPTPSLLHSSPHIPHTQTSTSLLILTPHPSPSLSHLPPHPHSTPLTHTVSLTPSSLSPPPGVPVPAVVSSPGGELALRLHFEAEHSNVLVVTAELLNGCLSRCEVHSMKMELLQDMYPHFPVSCCVPE